MKKCTKCGQEKELYGFSCDAKSNDGLKWYCRDCNNILRRNHKRTKRGLVYVIYNNQKINSKRKGVPQPLYTKYELYDFAMLSPDFHALYNEWVLSGYKKESSPSFDRDNDYKGYSLDNFNKWMKWKDNKRKGHDDIKNGVNNKKARAVVGVNITTGDIIEFFSAAEAERRTGINHTHIGRCCTRVLEKRTDRPNNYIRKSAGGFKWMFKSEAVELGLVEKPALV